MGRTAGQGASVNYDEVRAAFFDQTQADRGQPTVLDDAAPARRLRDAYEPLAMHAVWSPLVHERMAAKGLDFFGTYVWGRACVMGEPSGAVVASAFAAFEPSMIAGVYEGARAVVSRTDALATTFDAASESLAAVIGADDAAAVERVASRLIDVVDGLDGTGRPLFAGVSSLPWPADSYGRLFQACLALREHRGDGHVNAYVTGGCGPVEMNVLTELWLGYELGEYSGTRAWPDEATQAALGDMRTRGLLDGDRLSTEGRSVRERIEADTDAMDAPVVAALGDDVESVIGQLASWSQRCVDAAMFPPDPRKRAAG